MHVQGSQKRPGTQAVATQAVITHAIGIGLHTLQAIAYVAVSTNTGKFARANLYIYTTVLQAKAVA